MTIFLQLILECIYILWIQNHWWKIIFTDPVKFQKKKREETSDQARAWHLLSILILSHVLSRIAYFILFFPKVSKLF